MCKAIVKIVQINFDYGRAGIGGAGVAASRLHRSMLAAGLDSIYFCTFKREVGERVVEVPQKGFWRSLFLFGGKVVRHLPRLAGAKEPMPGNILSSGMARRINKLRPDAVIIHWISADCLSFGEIASIKAPLFCYLHDFWLLAANEHYFSDGDRRHVDGYRRSNSGYLERLLWERKKKLFEKRTDTAFVAPSKWAACVAKESFIGSRHNCVAIPNPLENTSFRFDASKAHKPRPFVILFGAFGGRGNRYKGFADLVAALELVPTEISTKFRVKVFGETAPSYAVNGVEVSFLGELTTAEDLVAAYHDADLFAFPSRQETQGQTKIEAMACGLPVVAFERTACAEGIIHKETGWIAPDGDIPAFRDGLLWWHERSRSQDWMQVRQKISETSRKVYSRAAIIQAWQKLFLKDKGFHDS
jgi:glycosyltransferase involved in cell wall biosynthesis